MLPVPDRSRLLPYQTARFIAEREVTVWYSVPSALMLMRPKLPAHDASRLRHVLFAGEVMPKAELRALAHALPRASFANLYGPTETNVCTFHRVEDADLRDDGPLPIGRPIDRTRIWILDDEGRPLAGAAPGELLVAGPTVFAGYLGDAELSARRLVPAPDGDGRACRTGDRVSRRPDGALQFHGRLDRMIKCRGHRIEPGEVESVLARHPGVREAAVVAVRGGTLGEGLRAHVASGPGTAPSIAELSALCRQHLPAYMVPDAWCFHDALPRTDRGKIDYRALLDA
jgi:acyl-coenzyme A synthetase/AMP-(fatty) acid ligase